MIFTQAIFNHEIYFTNLCFPVIIKHVSIDVYGSIRFELNQFHIKIRCRGFFFFFFFITLKPRVSNAQVYQPEIRALLGTASHFCEVVVLELKTVPGAPSDQLKL